MLELDNGEISFVTSKIWDGNLSETSHITSIGNIMYTSYSIWLNNNFYNIIISNGWCYSYNYKTKKLKYNSNINVLLYFTNLSYSKLY